MTMSSTPPTPRHSRLRMRMGQALAWAGVTVLLLLVFASYFQPAMVSELANQLWSCF